MKLKKYSVILAVLLLAILAIGAVSAESIDDTDVSTDSIDDVSVDITDNDVKNSLSAVALEEGEETSYDIDDNSYSTYFNENGTATDKLDPMGNYTLNIGTLNNKDMKIASGSNIKIAAKEDFGIINNGTITIGDGSGEAGSIIISGLTFTNTNKDGIVVNQFSTKVTIDNNKFDLTYNSEYLA
ncbi:MAG: hypothetical protein IJH65_09410, partial [Methanobrevibacter sp.]|nr:hypothetical protein [Methanobrevibacter sp.]